MSAARLAHLMDQLEAAALATVHAEESTDPIVRDTANVHARTYEELSAEIETLCAESPQARAEFFTPTPKGDT